MLGISAAMLSPRGAKNERIIQGSCMSVRMFQIPNYRPVVRRFPVRISAQTQAILTGVFLSPSKQLRDYYLKLDPTDSFQFLSSSSFTCHFVMDFAKSETMTALQNKP